MTEQEYINATNLAKISAAIVLLHDVLLIGGDHINEDGFRLIRSDLVDKRDRLRAAIKLDNLT